MKSPLLKFQIQNSLPLLGPPRSLFDNPRQRRQQNRDQYPAQEGMNSNILPDKAPGLQTLRASVCGLIIPKNGRKLGVPSQRCIFEPEFFALFAVATSRFLFASFSVKNPGFLIRLDLPHPPESVCIRVHPWLKPPCLHFSPFSHLTTQHPMLNYPS
jgi:hypothetical protein